MGLRFVAVAIALVSLGLGAQPARAISNITVNTVDDSPSGDPASCGSGAGTCSLRSALARAAAETGGSTVVVPAGTYALTSQPISVQGTVTLSGAGRGRTTIDASKVQRAFDVVGKSFTVTGVTINGGVNQDGGAAVRAAGADVKLTDVAVTGGASDGNGGGLAVSGGSVELNRVQLSNNKAANGGGLFTEAAAVKIVASRFEANGVWQRGGAVSISGPTALDIRASTFVENDSRLGGGAIYIEGDTRAASEGLTVATSTFQGNTSLDEGGGVFVRTTSTGRPVDLTFRGSTFKDNRAGAGGAMSVALGSVRIDGCSFTGNQAAHADGGAIASSGRLASRASTFTRNSSTTSGGAISADGTVSITTSSFRSNSAGTLGGALALTGASVPAVGSSTFVANTDTGGRPDIWRSGPGLDRSSAPAPVRSRRVSTRLKTVAAGLMAAVVALAIGLVWARSRRRGRAQRSERLIADPPRGR